MSGFFDVSDAVALVVIAVFALAGVPMLTSLPMEQRLALGLLFCVAAVVLLGLTKLILGQKR